MWIYGYVESEREEKSWWCVYLWLSGRGFCPLFYILAPYLILMCLRPFPTVAEVRLKVAVNLLISSLVLTYVMWVWGLLWLLYQTKLVKFQPLSVKIHTLQCWLIHAPPFQLFLLLPHFHRYVVPLLFILNPSSLMPHPLTSSLSTPINGARPTFPRPNPTHLMPPFSCLIINY